MRRTISVFLAALAELAVADPLTWESLLGSADKDPMVTTSRERRNLIASVDRAALWNELELRADVKRVDLLKQEFDLRVVPLALGERSASKSLWDERQDMSERQLDAGYGRVLHDRWRLGIRWLYQRRQSAYHAELARLYAERVRVLTSLAGDSRFDPQDLVVSQQAEVEARSEALGDASDIAAIEALLREWVPNWDTIALDTALLSSKELQERVEQLPQHADSSFPGWRLSASRLSVAEKHWQLEKAASKAVLTYLQVGYVWDRTAQSKTDAKNAGTFENVTAGFGIQLPFRDNSGQDLARRQVDLAEAKGNFVEASRELSQRYESSRAEVTSLAKQKAALDSFAARVDAGTLFANYARRAVEDPALLSKARIISLESSWRSERLRFEILFDYLDMLEMTGGLVRREDVHGTLLRAGRP